MEPAVNLKELCHVTIFRDTANLPFYLCEPVALPPDNTLFLQTCEIFQWYGQPTNLVPVVSTSEPHEYAMRELSFSFKKQIKTVLCGESRTAYFHPFTVPEE